jgi:pSer/pThr/pTyr-binding forkhead associated (FHA) protein
MSGPEVHIEDLNSTNGTYINGKAVTKQHLKHNDKIEIGKHTIRFVSEADVGALEKTMIMKKPPSAVAPTSEPLTASIRVVSGSAAGREVGLTKVVTTIGKPGVAVAAITRRPHGYVVALVEGANKATLNNHPLDQEAQTLKSGDVLELAGTKMEFIQG